MARAVVIILFLAVSAATLAQTLPQATWVDSDTSAPAGTSYGTFPSEKVGGSVSYLVYLPPEYESSGVRYPVVYWLHGNGGTQRSGAEFVRQLDLAIRSGRSRAMIAVLANGLRDSRWVDSFDGARPVETVFIRELIPHVDRTYRTIARREGRMIEGYSMGGFGAAHLGFEHTELFSAVSIMAGALLNDETVASDRPDLFEKNFGGNIDYFRTNSPWLLAERNASAIRGRIAVRIGLGELDPDPLPELNRKYHELLQRVKIEHEFFTLPGVWHEPGGRKFYEVLGAAGFDFYQKLLRAP